MRGGQGRRLRAWGAARRTRGAGRRRRLARRGDRERGGAAAWRRRRRPAARPRRAEPRGARRRARAPAPTSSRGARRSSTRWRARGGGRVHVKLDTGMGRLGTRDRDEATRVAQAAAASAPVAARGRDDALRHRGRTRRRLLRRAARALRRLGAAAARAPSGAGPARGELGGAAARRRPATSTWCAPAWRSTAWTRSRRMPAARELEPALELSATWRRSSPARAARARATAGASWPRRDTVIATVPIGYGDGVSRALTNNAELLVGGAALPAGRHGVDGQRHPGPRRRRRRRADRRRGACSIGAGLPAEEMARRLGTINYEITCSLTARVPREHHRDGVPL